MSTPLPLTTFYSGRSIFLWVEDVVTSAYLGECWNDPDIAFRRAGANDGVRVVVRNAQDEGLGYVFGFVDRDFRVSNRPGWHNPKSNAIFVPNVHEVENYLLDPNQLAGCDVNNGRRAAAEIDARLVARAGELVWWMACRRVLADLDNEMHAGFPPHSQVSDLAAAQAHICGSTWYRTLPAFIRQTCPAYKIADR